IPTDPGGRGPISTSLRTCSKALLPSNPPVGDPGGATAGIIACVAAEFFAGVRVPADRLSQPATHKNAKHTIVNTNLDMLNRRCIALTYMTERVSVIERTDLPELSERDSTQRIIPAMPSAPPSI